eukprot:PhM_4_TR5236/c5_g4_i4/m.758
MSYRVPSSCTAPPCGCGCLGWRTPQCVSEQLVDVQDALSSHRVGPKAYVRTGTTRALKSFVLVCTEAGERHSPLVCIGIKGSNNNNKGPTSHEEKQQQLKLEQQQTLHQSGIGQSWSSEYHHIKKTHCTLLLCCD